ncbi:hypothetical protein C5748_18060 [Phyllobacterium phragmitis]|uniref:DUF551 domain-containing protein n=1 Tax=Phyllobacterium phragmitis TaxID=2670329 RepID=A0A2S9INJ8_9HYPH|nr:hypothetical protein C5748_18060 [Phyllobacterium phragmitis]
MDRQPIETAPRDGTQILAYAKGSFSSGEHYYAVAQWAQADPDFPRTVDGWFLTFAIQPTHWMPLPPAPRQAGKEGGE